MTHTAIITGGSRGIGAATAKVLAGQGYAVEILYREQEETARHVAQEIHQSGGTARTHRVDVGDEPQVQRFVAGLEHEDAEVAVLVNNAGVAGNSLLLGTSLASWQHTLTTNLTGPFMMARAVVPLMLDRGAGTIINISSNSAHLPGPGQGAYAASKGGIEALTRAWAVELRCKNIRVNCVRPGRVRTDMSEASADHLNAMSPALWGEPKDLAEVIAFLASDAARYINGQVLCTDGGLSITRPQAGTP